MARPLRSDFPGAWHHVTHRGARKTPIFRDDEDCVLFLRSLEEAAEHRGIEVHAYALVSNEFHLLVRSVAGQLSSGIKHVMATFTLRANRRHRWDGPVFKGRFRSQLIGDDRFLDSVFAYVNLEPLHAGLAKRLEEPSWSSLRAYLDKESAPAWLRTDFFSARLGGPAKIADRLRTLRRQPEAWPEGFDGDTGWIRVKAEPAAKPAATPRRGWKPRPIAEALSEAARVTGRSVAEIKRAQMGPGANPARRFAVWALSREAGRSHREIGDALGMSESQVAKVLWAFRQGPAEEPIKSWVRELSDRG